VGRGPWLLGGLVLEYKEARKTGLRGPSNKNYQQRAMALASSSSSFLSASLIPLLFFSLISFKFV
jgi:hypothetical protein